MRYFDKKIHSLQHVRDTHPNMDKTKECKEKGKEHFKARRAAQNSEAGSEYLGPPESKHPPAHPCLSQGNSSLHWDEYYQQWYQQPLMPDSYARRAQYNDQGSQRDQGRYHPSGYGHGRRGGRRGDQY